MQDAYDPYPEVHAEHLEAVHGVGPHTISVPRVKKADDIDPTEFDNSLSIWLTPRRMIFSRISAVSLVETIIPVYGTAIRMHAAILQNISSLSELSNSVGLCIRGYTQKRRADD